MWTPNAIQTLFLNTLEETKRPMTLAEISEKVGQKIKANSISTLITKGKVIRHEYTYMVMCICSEYRYKVSVYELVEEA